MINVQEYIGLLLAIFREADQAVMNVYNSHSAIVTLKADNSPLTQADMAAHNIVTKGLTRLFPTIPIVSEEGDSEANTNSVRSDTFWLVDPLDGTKEFIKRTNHFTICAGLIEEDKPSFGLVSVPALGITYYGGPAIGSYKKQGKGVQPIHVSRQKRGIVLGSLSHPDPATTQYIAAHYPNARITQIGSQLKLLHIAEGLADAYPRINSPLNLWDLAAGHAILEGAGGQVTRPDGSALDYHIPSLKVGDFIASA